MKDIYKGLQRFLFILFVLFSFEGCKSHSDTIKLQFVGKTMGTTYSIKIDKSISGFQARIDSTLTALNKQFSTYDSTSQISKINNTALKEVCFKDEKSSFFNLLELSKQIYETTNHYFDPTVMPLVNYWGFGPTKIHQDIIDKVAIDSIISFVGFEKVSWYNTKEEFCFNKLFTESTIDLSAIAKGYAVDVIAELIDQLDVKNYMVEIGGEVRAKGKNEIGVNWRIGIDRPSSVSDLNQRALQAIAELNDKSLASSGNYRNFYIIDDKLVGHTINPKTGMPEVNNLLAVSVLAQNCATADGYATGFMAMGLEQALKIAEENSSIDAYFIYIDSTDNINVSYTSAFNDILVEIK